jgi:hypothetical protein
MKTIGSEEIFDTVSQFLKTKGVELTEGAYSRRFRKGCSLLTDAINHTQSGLQKAKTGVDRKLDEVRRIIHEKTAPPTPEPATQPAPPPPAEPAAAGPAPAEPPAAEPAPAKARKRSARKQARPAGKARRRPTRA